MKVKLVCKRFKEEEEGSPPTLRFNTYIKTMEYDQNPSP
jgi:hypothetical protein